MKEHKTGDKVLLKVPGSTAEFVAVIEHIERDSSGSITGYSVKTNGGHYYDHVKPERIRKPDAKFWP